MAWNLAQFEPIMRISIEKNNESITVTSTETSEVEFAGNIGFDVNFGSETKFGLKFGASPRHRRTVSTQIAHKLENKLLGDVVVDFGDKVVVSYQRRPATLFFPARDIWRIREYDNDMFAITVMPRRVQ
ncbi:MAG: hypothetical protein LBI15_06370 [Dysgonamonadaceae bacterium]|nr:hypothetical protein [Dysgonamonadaceae bacterium]